jgi:DNA-directed RNA polymerase subunit H (RpoH/RPB5)
MTTPERALLKVEQNKIRMMEARKCIITQKDLDLVENIPEAVNKFLRRFKRLKETNMRKSLNKYYQTEPDENEVEHKILAYYSTSASIDVNIEIANLFIGEVNDDERGFDIREAVFIVGTGLGAAASKEMVASLVTPYQTFLDIDLSYCPFNHKMYFPHEKVPDDKRECLLEDIQASPIMMPYIKAHDPIVKWHGWQIGDVIRIDRTDRNKTAIQKSIQYRTIIP